MYAFFNVIEYLRVALVVLFVGVSLLLLGASILRRSRFKDVRMSWSTGKLFGLPLGPTLFLAGVLIMIAYSLAAGRPIFAVSWVFAAAYVCGGLCWYLGALLSGSTIVSDWGIGARSGGRHVALPWREVTDYVVTPYKRKHRYVFFRVDAQGYKQRVEVLVPPAVKERFQSIVEFKLDTRFDRSIQRPMGQQALEK